MALTHRPRPARPPLRWSRATAREVDALAGDGGSPPLRYDPSMLDGLPAPVARYFTRVLVPGQPVYRHARLEQSGEIALARGRWMPFTATEVMRASPAGFVWDARVRMAPLVRMRVRDGFAGGRGHMLGSLAGLVPLVRGAEGPELAQGALVRCLAEGPWLPTSLLPCAGVRWAAVDDDSATATLDVQGVTASITAHFSPAGDIARVTALRHRDDGGRFVLTRFEGRSADYGRLGRMLVPRRSEAGWHLADGWFPFWRGHIDGATYW